MPAKILVVDDSATIRTQVTRTLTDAGYVVIGAADGLAALGELAGHRDIALVVCDVNMPRMTGLEFLAQAPRTIPVVMLTTEAEPALVQRAKALGAKGWLMKPFKPAMLLATASKLLAAAAAAAT